MKSSILLGLIFIGLNAVADCQTKAEQIANSNRGWNLREQPSSRENVYRYLFSVQRGRRVGTCHLTLTQHMALYLGPGECNYSSQDGTAFWCE